MRFVTRLSYQLDEVRPGCLSTRPYQQRPCINKTLSSETVYQQGLIVDNLGPDMTHDNDPSDCVLFCVSEEHGDNAGARATLRSDLL